MAGAFGTLTILDGAGTSRTVRVWDESGSGSGPFSFAGYASDGAGGGGELALQSGLTTINTTLGSPMQTTGGTVTANAGSGTFTISGSVTANAGTNLNTSLLALESGGNLATIAGAVSSSKMAIKSADGDQVTIGTTTGAAVVTDATGTLQQYLRGLVKLIAAGISATVSGTVTANAGTNLNTSALATSANLTAGTQKTQIVDGSGNVIASAGNALFHTNAPTSSSTSAASKTVSASASVTSLVVKASAGNLYGAYCTGIAGGAGYMIVYNGTTAPSTGALTAANVLDFAYFNGVAGCAITYSGIPPVNYSTGIVILLSSASTPFTYTTGTVTGAIVGTYA